MKRILCIAVLVLLALPSARAFSLGGPVGNGGDRWQLQNIGYGAPTAVVAPKNIGEGYRRNLPVMYYAYTPAFLDYFGSAGETNIDLAFSILNSQLSSELTNYSPGLDEVPLNTKQINYTAQAFQLYDIKSMTMSFMMEQLGLAESELNTWKLHDRILPTGGKCPIDELYTVIQRNYGITPSGFNQIQYSPYVNNTLYSFEILEVCSGAPVLADTVPFPVDTYADAYTSLSGFYLQYGEFYTGMTADDLAGVRYLLSPSNINLETVGGGSLLFDQSTNVAAGPIQFPTNTTATNGYGTYNLSSLYSYAITNPPAAVAAAFPGVVVANSTSYLVLASNATVTAYFVPAPNGYPIGTPPTLALATNYTLYLATNYNTTFANVVPVTTNKYTTNLLMTVTIGPKFGTPYGTLATNTSFTQIVLTNIPSGDFYTVPTFGTNLCGSGIQFLGLSLPVNVTNVVTSINTNLVTATNTTLYSVTQSIISSYTTHIYGAYPVNCGQTANATGLYRGMDKIKFVRVNYDSLLGQVIQPFTNSFNLVAFTNNQDRVEHFDRVVATPDIVIDAADLATGAADHPVFGTVIDETTIPVWNQANIQPGLAGPGTINPTTTLTFSKAGNLYEDGSLAQIFGTTNAFLGEYKMYQLLAYASFDGTTNDPVVYPNGSSIQNLQNELLVQISPAPSDVLANTGRTGVAYLYSGTNLTFSVSGGGGSFDLTDPGTWTTVGPPLLGSPASTGLPPGLTLSSSTGVLSGKPTQRGTFDFTLIFTDYYSHSVQWSYTIIIQ